MVCERNSHAQTSHHVRGISLELCTRGSGEQEKYRNQAIRHKPPRIAAALRIYCQRDHKLRAVRGDDARSDAAHHKAIARIAVTQM